MDARVGHEESLRAAGFNLVAGADEAGRGACAGPLVAAAVILPDGGVAGARDSKQLSPAQRETLYEAIVQRAVAWSVAVVEAGECDAWGMQAANLAALRRALLKLDPPPDFAIVDGFGVDGLPFPSLGVWKGDQVAGCVSAASILAKVTRDRMMRRLHEDYPAYGFDEHFGYCTASHQARLEELGPSPAHRLSFANVPGKVASL
ncbi:MAG: ribonuclease HII [Propionibacteriaceae bacterium]|nr:ribonuclease HII [Propionibacteriaceae bacterium]